MSRWQIRALYFYSHHDQRTELEFIPSAVNIIVGPSYSGKSAIIDTIDYCMGAGECHIPGIVRESCSWVGILWFKGNTEILVCRRVPKSGKSSEDVHFIVGSPVEVPSAASELRRTSNVDGALRLFEQHLLMGNVTGETFTARQGQRLSSRNALPYILVSDDVIINKLTLFRGMNDERRQSVIDSLPYFLGAVDESTAGNEIKLKRLKTQYEREERQQAAALATANENVAKADVLIQEAIELGMVEAQEAVADIPDVLTMLAAAAEWTPGAEVDAAGTGTLDGLYRQERDAVSVSAQIRSQLQAARDTLHSAERFGQTVTRQRRKLDVTSVFRGTEEHICPLCSSSIAERTDTLDSVRDALKQLDGELRDVQQERPQIDTYITRLEEEARLAGQELTLLREKIAGVIRESEANSQRLDMDQRRARVAGRVSYFLEVLQREDDQAPSDRLDRLRSEIESLEAVVDPEAKAERLRALETQISTYASGLLDELPFDENYRDVKVMFEARKVAVRFVRGARVMDMRDVGGDESYLSGRMSVVLALHRTFAEGNRPVPGVVVFDQISRPFYAPESNPGEVLLQSADRQDLLKYFNVLFDEVESQGSLQVIVLEHAYFADDATYKQAVLKRWGNAEKLIPAGWPRVEIGGSNVVA